MKFLVDLWQKAFPIHDDEEFETIDIQEVINGLNKAKARFGNCKVIMVTQKEGRFRSFKGFKGEMIGNVSVTKNKDKFEVVILSRDAARTRRFLPDKDQ